MTLPPISQPSLPMVARSFPPRALVILTAAVVAVGIAGWLLAVAMRF
jgi:hypothetical protein